MIHSVIPNVPPTQLDTINEMTVGRSPVTMTTTRQPPDAAGNNPPVHQRNVMTTPVHQTVPMLSSSSIIDQSSARIQGNPEKPARNPIPASTGKPLEDEEMRYPELGSGDYYGRSYSHSNSQSRRDHYRPDEPRIRLPEYNGKSEWRAFYKKFNLLSSQYDWDEAKQLEKMVICLQGPAWDFAARLPDATQARISTFVTALDHRFGDHTLPETRRAELRNIKKKHSETRREYEARIRKLMSLAYPGMEGNQNITGRNKVKKKWKKENSERSEEGTHCHSGMQSRGTTTSISEDIAVQDGGNKSRNVDPVGVHSKESL